MKVKIARWLTVDDFDNLIDDGFRDFSLADFIRVPGLAIVNKNDDLIKLKAKIEKETREFWNEIRDKEDKAVWRWVDVQGDELDWVLLRNDDEILTLTIDEIEVES